MAVAENYPDLKANEGFRDLRTELVGSENRVSTAIKYFNEAVGDYNTYIRKFPNNLTASMFGFEKKGYFKAEEGASKAPKVKF
jgi:LemA protein